MLFTKCILDKIKSSDGVRISVMSRHTLKDGVTPDKRLDGQYDHHLKELAPPSRVVGDYYNRGLPWGEYKEKYIEFLKNPKVQNYVKNLAYMSTKKDITILCIEEDSEFCHRRILAEECKKYEPDLHVEHK